MVMMLRAVLCVVVLAVAHAAPEGALLEPTEQDVRRVLSLLRGTAGELALRLVASGKLAAPQWMQLQEDLLHGTRLHVDQPQLYVTCLECRVSDASLTPSYSLTPA
jgi:hypothetical protein